MKINLEELRALLTGLCLKMDTTTVVISDEELTKIITFLTHPQAQNIIEQDFNSKRFDLFDASFGDFRCQARPIKILEAIIKNTKYHLLDDKLKLHLTLCHVLRMFKLHLRDGSGMILDTDNEIDKISYPNSLGPLDVKQVLVLSHLLAKLTVDSVGSLQGQITEEIIIKLGVFSVNLSRNFNGVVIEKLLECLKENKVSMLFRLVIVQKNEGEIQVLGIKLLTFGEGEMVTLNTEARPAVTPVVVVECHSTETNNKWDKPSLIDRLRQTATNLDKPKEHRIKTGYADHMSDRKKMWIERVPQNTILNLGHFYVSTLELEMTTSLVILNVINKKKQFKARVTSDEKQVMKNCAMATLPMLRSTVPILMLLLMAARGAEQQAISRETAYPWLSLLVDAAPLKSVQPIVAASEISEYVAHF